MKYLRLQFSYRSPPLATGIFLHSENLEYTPFPKVLFGLSLKVANLSQVASGVNRCLKVGNPE